MGRGKGGKKNQGILPGLFSSKRIIDSHDAIFKGRGQTRINKQEEAQEAEKFAQARK